MSTMKDVPPKPTFSDEEYDVYYELKKSALEKILGPTHHLICGAVIGFDVGGPVDLYRFPQAISGTALTTMELIEPDGSGPRPSRLGTYELIAFTRHAIDDARSGTPFSDAETRIRSFLTAVARLSYDDELNPFDTCEVPGRKGDPACCLVFDEWKKEGVDFVVAERKHGLLLCIEVFRSEMDFAIKNRTASLLERLKAKGHYPYGDLDRQPVA